MNKLVMRFSILGAIFVIVVGSLLHFVYEWTGDNFVVGLFAPINESVWEHMKLAFVPILIFAIVDYIYLKSKVKNFSLSLIVQQIFVIAFIIAFFYLYNLFTEESLFLDIFSFVAGVVLAKWIGYKILTSSEKGKTVGIVSTVLIVILAGFFVLATLNPPRISLFQDPETGTYGIHQLK